MRTALGRVADLGCRLTCRSAEQAPNLLTRTLCALPATLPPHSLQVTFRLEDVEAVAVDHRGPAGVAATRCFSTGVSGFGVDVAALEPSPRSALTAVLSRSNSSGACSSSPAPDPARHGAQLCCVHRLTSLPETRSQVVQTLDCTIVTVHANSECDLACVHQRRQASRAAALGSRLSRVSLRAAWSCVCKMRGSLWRSPRPGVARWCT